MLGQTFQVALMIRTRSGLYGTFCGGTIIARNKIISAAHCFEEKGIRCFTKPGRVSKKLISSVFAVAGNLRSQDTYSSYGRGQWRNLKSAKYPRSYKFPTDDIALLITIRPFVINSHVAPIPYTTVFIEYTGNCLASGFGRINDNQQSRILLKANLPILSIEQCSRVHRKNMRKFVCTSSAFADVHKGDSGGPLVCKRTGDPNEGRAGILVGVVSGKRISSFGGGTFFTRVASFTKFIKSKADDRETGRNRAWCLYLLCIIYDRFLLF